MKHERCHVVTIESRCGKEIVARVRVQFPMSAETRRVVDAVIRAAERHAELLHIAQGALHGE